MVGQFASIGFALDDERGSGRLTEEDHRGSGR